MSRPKIKFPKMPDIKFPEIPDIEFPDFRWTFSDFVGSPGGTKTTTTEETEVKPDGTRITRKITVVVTHSKGR